MKSVASINVTRPNGGVRAVFSSAIMEEHASMLSWASEILHPNEYEYFRTLRYEKRQLSYLLGRLAAKKALSLLLDETDLTSMEIKSGVFQQPVVHYLSTETVGVSISHTGRYAVALAFPEVHPMAIDMETITLDHQEAIQTQLTSKEIEWLASCQLPVEVAGTLLWTIKEGLSKVLRTGLTIPCALMEINELRKIRAHDYYESAFTHFRQYKSRSWIVHDQVVSIIYPVKSEMDLECIEKVIVCKSDGI
ncbi:MAG TPA: 4'-phosphopantetheinyl transferase superfamily protein [Brevibacillus sp.]|nr:4'-phosphopantetheinyl transferase superfamily protein [Brevibacillus sp.]